jgi:hypothetical protein
MNNAQVALVAAAIDSLRDKDVVPNTFATAERYKQWLDGQETLAARLKLSDRIMDDDDG